jgi:hypothetical protein
LALYRLSTSYRKHGEYHMKVILRICTTCIICLFILSCASITSQRIGQSSYPSRPDTAEVLVFTSDTQIKDKFETIGTISYNNPGKYRILTLESAMKPLKKQARQLGANAIIIDKSHSVRSGIISTGINVKARAVLISTNSNR